MDWGMYLQSGAPLMYVSILLGLFSWAAVYWRTSPDRLHAGLRLPFVVALLVASLPAILVPLARFSGRVNQPAGASLLVRGALLLAGAYPSLARYLGQPFVGR